MAKKKTFDIPPLDDGRRPAPGALDNLIQDSRAILPGWVKLSDVYYVKPGDLQQNRLNSLFKKESPEYFERLTADIKERGLIVPLIARREKEKALGLGGVLLAGHNRLKIALALRLEKIPVQYVLNELAPEQERAFVVKDNLFRRQLTPEDRLDLYRLIIPDFDERIKQETRGGDRTDRGANGKDSHLPKGEGLTAGEMAQAAQAAGLDVSRDTAQKDLARARKAAKPTPKEPALADPAQNEARRLKAVKAHGSKIIEALNGATEQTNKEGILEVLGLLEFLTGEDKRLAAHFKAIRAALE